MPLKKLQFRPGINREGTNYSNEGGWFDCDKVRFRSGYPEKIGGWTQNAPNQYYQGVCRAMINWIDLNNNNLIGIGTHLKYYINRSAYYDITPIAHTSSGLSSPFATTTGSRIITVTDAGYAPSVGSFVTFSGATGFNGILAAQLNTEFVVINVLSGTTYQIQLPVGVTASGTGSGGGTVQAAYQIAPGLPAYTTGNGFGAGIWNGVNVATGYNTTLAYTSGPTPWDLLNSSSTTINVADTSGFSSSGTIIIDAEVITYSGKTSTSFTGCVRGTNGSTAVNHGYRPTAGTPDPVRVYAVTGLLGSTGWGQETSGAGTGVAQQMRVWTNDSYGQDLLIAPRGGPIYYWVNNTSTFPRAAPLTTDVPIVATNQVLVSDVSRFVISMGCNSYGSSTFDPMLVRWSDQENPNVWTPEITNQSGEQRLSNGSYIMQAKRNRQEIIIWTDSALYSMQYIGPPYVWGFQLMMDNISIVGPNAAIVVNNVAYWMGTDKFYSYSGVVSTLPCAVRQYVFDDLNYDQRFQIVAGSVERFNEVWWFYVSNAEVAAAAQESRTPINDKYVAYNYLENTWYYGSMRRTYWLDSHTQPNPLSAQCKIPSGGQNSDNAHTDISFGNTLWQEFGYDDASTSAAVPFTTYVQSSDFDIDDGDHFGFVWRMIPDVNFTGSNSGYPFVTFQLQPREFPGSAYSPSVIDDVASTQRYTALANQYKIQQFTNQIYTRLRGRQLNITVTSEGQLGVAWQLGSPRMDIRPDGRR